MRYLWDIFNFNCQKSKIEKKSGKMVAYPPVLSFSLAYLEGPTANEEKTLSLFFKSATWQTTLSWNNDIFTNVFLFSCRRCGIFDKDDEGSLKSYLFSVASSCRCRLCCTEFYAWNAASKEVDLRILFNILCSICLSYTVQATLYPIIILLQFPRPEDLNLIQCATLCLEATHCLKIC